MRKQLIVILLALLALTGCVKEERMSDTPMGNFEALWKMIDEHYCFLDYKRIDWDSIYVVYERQVQQVHSSKALFEVLGNMLAELRDGHVNLSSTHDVARYWDWFENYPRNYSEELVENYLGQGYRMGGGMKYTILEDNIGYVSYTSFSSPVGDGSLSELLDYMAVCDGLIIDVRNNGGGIMTYADRIAARFTNAKTLVGYICYKTGKGHSDFSEPTPIYIEPYPGIRWQKKVVVLTNRHTYSAANYFTNVMQQMPNVVLMGDQTGGGSGLPFSSELPNGWGVRFSACPILNADRQHTEFGVVPDVAVGLDDDDRRKGVDSMIEAARVLLKEE